MALDSRITLLAQAVAADIKALTNTQGALASLTTDAKTSLVAAINELQSEINAVAAGTGAILDTATDGDTTHTWSANKIYDELQALKTSLIDGAPAAYDTLIEISNYLSGNDTAVSGLVTAVANRVSYADVQTLTTGQKLQACTNIGVGDPDTDFVTAYTTAKA